MTLTMLLFIYHYVIGGVPAAISSISVRCCYAAMKAGEALLLGLLWCLCIRKLEQTTQAPYQPVPTATNSPVISSFIYSEF